ncbi:MULTISPECIES: hypothetical protein, partial [unclassified Microbispora]|uniref:hypothetical protein n=1 Tax=unclassified Microbispora TaxID=2614687 RepID=UPI00197C33E4
MYAMQWLGKNLNKGYPGTTTPERVKWKALREQGEGSTSSLPDQPFAVVDGLADAFPNVTDGFRAKIVLAPAARTRQAAT